MANPVFTRNKEFQGTPGMMTPQQSPVGFEVPPMKVRTEFMTYEGTLMRAGIYFVLAVLTGAAVGTFAPGLAWPLSFVGLALALVVAFSKNPHPALMGATVMAYGGLAGGWTVVLDAQYPGIALQAVLGTVSVFAGVLFLYRSGRLRTSKRMNKIFMAAFAGYFIFSLVNVGLLLFTDMDGFGLRSMSIGDTGIPWGVPLGILGILLASYLLVRDFEFIDNGVRTQAPSRTEWLGAYGLVFTLIWLYIEILRLLAILRGR